MDVLSGFEYAKQRFQGEELISLASFKKRQQGKVYTRINS